MKSEYVEHIIAALKSSQFNIGNLVLTGDTKFSEIESFDSMSAVNFQTDLSTYIGEKAFGKFPQPEMTVSEFAELLLEAN